MITYAKYTSIGERSENEDSVMSVYDEHFGYSFVVADGLGGHGCGKEASSICVDTFKEEFEAIFSKSGKPEEPDRDELQDSQKTNELIKEENIENSKDADDKILESGQDIELEAVIKYDMKEYLIDSFEKTEKRLTDAQDKANSPNEYKTTGVALTISEDKLMWGHIGDSRLYMFNNNKLVTRTLDHSVPQMLVLANDLKEKKIRNHPDRNKLLRVLGSRLAELKVDYSDEYDIDDCQAFLLCTDGFWECITEKKMIKFLKKASSVEDWMNMMVKEVEKNGAGTNMDNNSAIAVWVKDNRSGRLWM